MGDQRRIGVFGGTFDPIHVGHLYIAANAQSALGLEQVILMPSGIPPHKRNKNITASHHRFQMCELAIANEEVFTVSDLEIKREGISYSILTLDELQASYGESVELVFIIGGDMLADLPSWHRVEALLTKYHVLALSRPGYNLNEVMAKNPLLQQYRHRIWIQEILPIEISATALRASMIKGQNVRYLIPDSVLAYIQANNIYVNRCDNED